MFKDNKYTRWYNSIIERARVRKLPKGEYKERHHYIPKCMGGVKTVNLTAREHFICHMLLTKMSDDHRLKFALVMMARKNPKQGSRIRVTSHSYEYIKKCNSVASSIRQTYYDAKHNVGKVHCHDPETGKLYLKFPDQVPDGYVLGRSADFVAKLKGQHKGNAYYYDPTTMKVVSIKPGNIVPDGYIKGNPNANTGKFTRGILWWHNPVTYEQTKSKIPPDGFVRGKCSIWITDGITNKQVLPNHILLDGWRYGKTGNVPRRQAIKPINTPLGTFDHPLRFCEKYDCDSSVLKNLNTKLKKRSSHIVLNTALENIGYDFSKTKAENGFKFID